MRSDSKQCNQQRVDTINEHMSPKMERVPTRSASPYVGTFQYRNAGPDRIHRPVPQPFYLPPSIPYIGSLRHDIPAKQFYIPMRTLVENLMPHKSVQVQTDVTTADASTQTEVDLGAYVIVNYHTPNT